MNSNSKIVLVTGASRGLGKSIAIDLVKNGYTVIINYCSNDSEANNTLNILKEFNDRCDLYKCDISNENDVKSMIDYIVNKYGKLDIVVNNAGIALDTTFEDKTVENFRRILDVNLIGTFLVSKYASISMLKNKCGKIINIASTNGIDTYYPEGLDYDASKAGVISLTHNLAKQFAPYINVNAVCPGWIDTDMNKELDKEFIDKECEKILLNRFAEPDEIASLVSFLVSDKSNYINSTIIRIDGGKNE